MVEPDQQRASFWSTLPGILTGVATLITAIAAVVAIFVGKSDSPSGGSASPPTPATSSTTSSPSSTSSSPSAPSPSSSGTRTSEGWPTYPGIAVVGTTGPVARGWQEILIRCGAISDIPENHDGTYGTATGEKVEQLESHWGWRDADTTADRLTYNHIINAGCS